MIDEVISEKVDSYTEGGEYAEEWDWDGLRSSYQKLFLAPMPFDPEIDPALKADELKEKLRKAAHAAFAQKEQALSLPVMRQVERFAMLRIIDERWREHLYEMDQMKEGIGLRAYGQKDPLIEYKSEGFRMFKEMLGMISEQVIELIFKAQVALEPAPVRRRMPQQMTAMHRESVGMGFEGVGIAPPRAPEQQRAGKRQPVVVEEKIGRNDPCPCGSGKKYKKCHGAA
jgi:preprotein translocase subunit SecA